MHNAAPLIEGLSKSAHCSDVEIILLDDASPQKWPVAQIKHSAMHSPLSISLIESPDNLGRSGARNALLQSSRGAHVLFLDADMIPDSEDFLDRWIALINSSNPDIAFGGFTLLHAKVSSATALHRFVSLRSDCRPAALRNRDPAQFTTTSNLLVRRSVLDLVPFDEGFSGWGWEDVDWALRAASHYRILHVDISATHDGLDDTDTLLRKALQAGPNYRRLVERHPIAVQRFRSFGLAKRLSKLPMLERLKTGFRALTRIESAPMPVRAAAYKLFRTLTYAASLR
jgi:glycosyltransferase involved in cell wall biosynthesis